MAKPHWQHTINPETGGAITLHGCQHSICESVAEFQWQREATDEEVQAQQNLQGPYGDVIRSPQGPHHVAVFSCKEHAGEHFALAATHKADCPAPDAGCECG